MVKLNEILAAINDPEVCMAHCAVLRGQWHMERGLPNIDSTNLDVMRYIETLEDDRRHLLASVMQLLTIARGEQSYHNGIILKAQHLLATIDQPQHEREAAR